MAERKITIRRVMAGEREISYQLERKAVKNLNLRVREDGSVYASAPRRVSAAEIDAFVASRGAFILQAVARRRSGSGGGPCWSRGSSCEFWGRSGPLSSAGGTS